MARAAVLSPMNQSLVKSVIDNDFVTLDLLQRRTWSFFILIVVVNVSHLLHRCNITLGLFYHSHRTSPKTQINETQHNHQTISENTSIGPKIINSPSLCTELPFSKRRTQVIVLPITHSPIPNKLAKVLPTNLPSHSTSLSDRMELDIHPVRGGSTQSSPTIYK